MSTALRLVTVLLFVASCAQEKSGEAEATASAPAETAPVPPPAPTETAGKPRDDCPEGSAGEGTLKKPCEAKGTARTMELSWNGKMTDKGPSFRVTNKTKLVIVYGKLNAYFYDKAGKQLEVKPAGGKPRPSQPCSGFVFGGPMKPGEKATINFSCVKKEHVPEGTVAVEAEMETVGFADADGKKVEYYWRNADLTPDARPKGGAK